MKHLLNGVAIAAAFALAAPAWAQAPATPSSPSAAKPAAAAPMAPMRHKRMVRHSTGDQTTAQLNRQELARIGAGAGAPPMPAGAYGQPSTLTGIPGAGQPSASSHAATSSTPPGPMPASMQVSPSEGAPVSEKPLPPGPGAPQVSPSTHPGGVVPMPATSGPQKKQAPIQ